MTWPIIIALMTVAVALVSSIFAARAWMTAQKALMLQLLLDVLKDYRSSEMMIAVESLWNFYKKHGKHRFTEEYERLRNEERDWLQKMPKHDRAKYAQGTLHYQRRLVSQFYQCLADIYVLRIVPEKLIYMQWSKSDLEIIPKIIIPLENILDPSLQRFAFSHLRRLYKGSKQYWPDPATRVGDTQG